MSVSARAATGCCVLALWASAGWAAEPASPYIQLGLGASFLEGLSVTGPAGNTLRLNENVGGLGTSGIGYAFGNGFRTEFEFGYRWNSAKNVTLPGGGTTPTALNLKANAAALTYMVNGLYAFDIGPTWKPYIGFGVGAAEVRVSNIGHSAPFAWQAIAGIEYPLSPNLRIGAAYKYLNTESLDLHATPVSLQSRANYEDHAALLTLRWSFGAPKPVQPIAAASPPPPAPPPPAPPLAMSYTVYFAFGSAALDAPARDIVRQAAAGALRNAATNITVTGHTDTVGSASFNQRLSERRAQSVRRELIADGVPGDQIVMLGRGEAELAVATGQNVQEPRNRRVVIDAAGPGF